MKKYWNNIARCIRDNLFFWRANVFQNANMEKHFAAWQKSETNCSQGCSGDDRSHVSAIHASSFPGLVLNFRRLTAIRSLGLKICTAAPPANLIHLALRHQSKNSNTPTWGPSSHPNTWFSIKHNNPLDFAPGHLVENRFLDCIVGICGFTGYVTWMVFTLEGSNCKIQILSSFQPLADLLEHVHKWPAHLHTAPWSKNTR